VWPIADSSGNSDGLLGHRIASSLAVAHAVNVYREFRSTDQPQGTAATEVEMSRDECGGELIGTE
jgi:hypothetical protein